MTSQRNHLLSAQLGWNSTLSTEQNYLRGCFCTGERLVTCQCHTAICLSKGETKTVSHRQEHIGYFQTRRVHGNLGAHISHQTNAGICSRLPRGRFGHAPEHQFERNLVCVCGMNKHIIWSASHLRQNHIAPRFGKGDGKQSRGVKNNGSSHSNPNSTLLRFSLRYSTTL